MADVVLAGFGAQAWLVRGEEHIDDLLNNSMPPDVTIEVVACESKSAVDALWQQWNDDDPAMMWLIHPAIVNRARGQSGDIAVLFGEWSAALDEAAQQAVQAAANAVAARAGGWLTLVRHVPDAPPMALTMADLRSGLLEAKLHELGVMRIERETRPVLEPGQGERIVLLPRD